MKIHTVQLNLENLSGGTMHMDSAEFGAYVRLFLACYRTSDHKLPSNDLRLARIAHCNLKVWKRIKLVVLEKFIDDGSGSLVHEVVMREVLKYADKSSINRANRLKGLNMKRPSVDQALTSRQQPKNKDLRPIEDTNVSSTPISPKGYLFDGTYQTAGMLFEIFWNIYPNISAKGNKQAAWLNFQKLIEKGEDHDAIITGCRRYAEFIRREGQYNTHASTFLSTHKGKSPAWLGEWAPGLGRSAAGAGHSHAEVVAEGFRRALFPDGGEEPDRGGHGI